MRLNRHNATASVRAASLHDRILGDSNAPRDDALIFAASSVISEITAPQYDGSPVLREVRTEHGRYVLKASRVYANDGVQPVVLVYAEAAPIPAIPDQPLRERFGLTRKEARVAALLAGQKSNEEIARELFISPHTARHHTQSVLEKLGVSSRREVAGVLQSI